MLTRPSISLLITPAAAVIFLTGSLYAMGFEKFDAMPTVYQAEYVAAMVQATETAFRKEGRNDLAEQVDKLFSTTLEGDLDPLGLIELERNISLARVADFKRFQGDPKARRIDVEDALLLTLKKNNLYTQTMPQGAMNIMRSFHITSDSEFVAMSVAERRQWVATLVKIAVPDYFFRDNLADQIAKKTPTSTDTVREDLARTRYEFGSVTGTSAATTGYDTLTKTLEAQATRGQKTAVSAELMRQINNKSITALQRKDAVLVRQAEDMYDHRSIILADGRHVLPDKTGGFMVIKRNIDDPGVPLEQQYWPEARFLLNCVKGVVNCKTAKYPAPARSPQAASPPPPKAAPVDDPIGQGGFIRPPN